MYNSAETIEREALKDVVLCLLGKLNAINVKLARDKYLFINISFRQIYLNVFRSTHP